MNYDGIEVVNLLMTGVREVGTLGRVGIWKPENRSANISTATLLLAKAEQVDAGKIRSECAEDDVIWQTTLEEVEDGCLTRPFSAAQLSQKLGEHWVPRGDSIES